uniref:Tf2-1-like SH3-like domain-containing protein n=1 Tax=Tanacetum cinerariifolium TaxID=118510 RepID=A0A6L2N387_TANCI|nr:hypothetical protein [Tanacetum cinerariifolium]
MPTEMELVLEQTQQGTSHEVSVSTEGVEELKRNVKIKGEKKEALHTLRQKPEHPGDTYVFTMKMEILLEPTSNKLLVENSVGDPLMLRLVLSPRLSEVVKDVGDGLKGVIFVVWWWRKVKRAMRPVVAVVVMVVVFTSLWWSKVANKVSGKLSDGGGSLGQQVCHVVPEHSVNYGHRQVTICPIDRLRVLMILRSPRRAAGELLATWLKTFEEFTRGWVRLGCLDVDTQTMWMQRERLGLKAEMRDVLSLPYRALELEGHTFIIDLIPFGHGSFDVIVGMDWLSKLRERLDGNLKQSKTVKVNELKFKDIPVVHNFPSMFPEDLSSLPASRKVEFRIDLIPGAMPVAKSPYRLEPTKMQELSNQLKDLKEKGFIRPSSSPWGALVLFVKKKDGSFQLLEKEKLFGKFSKCEFWLQEVRFLGHVVNSGSIHVNPSKDEAVKNWKPPPQDLNQNPFIRRISGILRAIYRKFLKDFKPLTLLTQKNKKFEWGDEKENAFQALRVMLCDAPIFALPEGPNDFSVIYTDHKSLPYIFDKKELNMRQRRWIKLFSDVPPWKRNKPLEFSVGDKVLLKVSPWKGMVRFGKRNKLSPRYVGSFEVVQRVGPVAYRLRLPQELAGIHDTFHVSNLKKCLADVNLHVPLEEIKIDDKLRIVEEPIEIMDREVTAGGSAAVIGSLLRVHRLAMEKGL